MDVAEKNLSDKSSLGKVPSDDVDIVDEKGLKEVGEFEERLALDGAADEEYLVQDAHDVAIKVSMYCSSVKWTHPTYLGDNTRSCRQEMTRNYKP